MGSSNLSPELSFDFIPKTIDRFLGQVSTTSNVNDKVLQIDQLINQLEIETQKIQLFKEQLPLCMLFINHAIVALKEESMVLKNSSNVEPVLEEFIPLKNTSSDDDAKLEIITQQKDGDKKNWLSSTQLWNSNENHNQNTNLVAETVKKRAEEQDDESAYFNRQIKNSMRGNDFVTEINGNSRLIPCSTSNVQSNVRIGGGTVASQTQQQTSRKQRRCWSTELHRRFVNALQQLGGSQAATPKQIRELMQVDGLTNDEVKSHLQKYRLHTRRHPSTNTNQPTVVLGGLWMPTEEQHYIKTSKSSNSHSGSPDGPLPNRGNTMDDEEDEKSENYCWNGNL